VPSVRSIVSFGKGPVPVEESEIQALQAVVGSGLSAEPHAFLRAGIAVLWPTSMLVRFILRHFFSVNTLDY